MRTFRTIPGPRGSPVAPALLCIVCGLLTIVAAGDRSYGVAAVSLVVGALGGLIAARRIWYGCRNIFPLFPRS